MFDFLALTDAQTDWEMFAAMTAMFAVVSARFGSYAYKETDFREFNTSVCLIMFLFAAASIAVCTIEIMS